MNLYIEWTVGTPYPVYNIDSETGRTPACTGTGMKRGEYLDLENRLVQRDYCR